MSRVFNRIVAGWWQIPLLVLLMALVVALALFYVRTGSVDAADVQTSLIISICGDGLANAGELCDAGPGANTGAYGSSTAERVCAPGCMSFGPYCGDGVLQVRFSEECDDGENTEAGICDAQCVANDPSPAGGGGSPTVGSTPTISGATPGSILSQTETKVVLRGKAYPNRDVNVVKDGQAIGVVRADANADFVFSSTEITAGTATFGFWAEDTNGTDSITTAVVFEVVQSAVTTVANIFIPPSMNVSERQVAPGGLLTLSGMAVPASKISAQLDSSSESPLVADADATGKWALQLDTASISEGFHSAKSLFELQNGSKSGYGRSVSFYVGEGTPVGGVSPDINQDGKVNLVDFSIFLLSWGTDDIRSDFNQDGAVNLADFSIMLFSWTG